MADDNREWATRGDYDAECLMCGWRCTARNALGVGAQHARKHKHTVRVEVVRTVIYDHGYMHKKEPSNGR